MASHSGYTHLLHHHLHPQPSTHLPPPPQSSAAQPPDRRLPSLRSLNFAYPPVGEPGATTVEAMTQPQQRVEQPPRTSFAQPDEYYHQRDMSYYQDPPSSSQTVPAPPTAKRARSPSNSDSRSPYALQANGSPNVYHPQAPEAHGRSAGGGAYAHGHAQGATPQFSHPHQQQQPESTQSHPPPFYTRLPQPSPAWYYQSAQHQHPPPPNPPPVQQPTPNQHPQQHQQTQPQHAHHQPLPPQSITPKHTLTFQSYPPPPSAHSPLQQQARGSFSAAPSQGHLAPTSSPSTTTLAGPGSTAATLTDYSSSSPAAYVGPASSLSGATAPSRGVDVKTLGEDAERAAAAGMHLTKIMEHSRVLCDFANHYAETSHTRPAPAEVAEMAQRATLVLQLVEHLRRMASAAGALAPAAAGEITSPHAGRAYQTSMALGGDRDHDRERDGEDKDKLKGSKKRLWEDDTGAEVGTEDSTGDRSAEEHSNMTSFDSKDISAQRSVAESDMAMIRSKRGPGSAAGATQGAIKAKYRKRSRATPPGKCHSCNIRETPEWRRGPDGARTLCNACGLHYAKLIRKRDKAMGTNASSNAPPIDLEMLRASTRLAGDPPGPKPSTGPGMHSSGNAAFRDADSGDIADLQLQSLPIPGSDERGAALAPQLGVAMHVHQWTPPAPPAASVHREESGGYELSAFSTSLMRSSNARASPP